MDVKTTFLRGTLKEDVYVYQSKGFIDADHLSHVYKFKTVLYGLKQAPKAWYDELSTFLLRNHFIKGTIDLTLFIRIFDDGILVVQVYVDDIIFDTFKSTSGGAQFLGKKLMRTQLTDYGYYFNKIPIYCDSKSAIAISCNPVQQSRKKHIVVRYHFIKENVEKVQPDNQNADFSGSNQIQTLQYPDVNPPSLEISNEENFQAKGDLMTSIQTFLESFNCIPVEEKPQILFQTWETFFAIQCSQPEDSKELFQKLLKDLKELAEYDQSTRTNRIHQLIEECSIEVPEEQKQKMENTMFDLVKICQEKEFLCIHDDVDNLVESALDSKLLLINLINSQHLDKKEQEVKNVIEQPTECRNQPEHLLSMGYEHLSITPETEPDEVTESNAENLLPILSKCEVTLEDEIKCDMPTKDVCSPVFTTFSNPLFKDNDDLDSSDDESLLDEDVPAEEFKIYLNPLCDEDEINSDKLDPHCFNVESDFVESLINCDTFIDFSSKFDFSSELAHIKPEIPKSDFDFEEEIYDFLLEEVDLLLSDNSIPPGIENVADDPEGDICFLEELLINDSILSRESSDSNFEDSPLTPRPPSEPPDDNCDLEPEKFQNSTLILRKKSVLLRISFIDNSFPRPPEELNAEIADTIIESIPLPIPVQDEGDIRFLEELLIDNSILSHESFDSSFEDSSLIPRPPPEPPDAETNAGEEIAVVMIDKDKFDDDYQIFMFDKVFSTFR
uniref:Retrovirus-related Pol polyprotein from transposon TNT 1-94 n=1 Tax=Tanacetum cinerariifolium TaxID=118510 RepID=A0A6L2N1P2_TANCI|nr:retrovirus-related Pol polyprotein from transposon TNT 1-94 [Tanacetum cinerariifolium]